MNQMNDMKWKTYMSYVKIFVEPVGGALQVARIIRSKVMWELLKFTLVVNVYLKK